MEDTTFTERTQVTLAGDSSTPAGARMDAAPGGVFCAPLPCPAGQAGETASSGRDSSLLDTVTQSVTNEAEVESAELGQRLQRWANLVSNARGLAAYIRKMQISDQWQERAARLESCGPLLGLRQAVDGQGVHRRWVLNSGAFCKQPYMCAFCASWRSVRLVKTYGPRVCHAIVQGMEPRFLTFTQKTGVDLKERLTNLRKAMKKLSDRRRQSRVRNAGSCFGSMAGGVGQIEIKRSSVDGKWHPHVHMTAVFDKYPDYKGIKSEWSDILGYPAQVKQKELRGMKLLTDGEIPRHEALETLGRDVCETLKYPLKLDELTSEDICHIVDCLKRGSRLVFSFGCLRGDDPPDDYLPPNEQPDWSCLEFRELWFSFVSGRYEPTPPPRGSRGTQQKLDWQKVQETKRRHAAQDRREFIEHWRSENAKRNSEQF